MLHPNEGRHDERPSHRGGHAERVREHGQLVIELAEAVVGLGLWSGRDGGRTSETCDPPPSKTPFSQQAVGPTPPDFTRDRFISGWRGSRLSLVAPSMKPRPLHHGCHIGDYGARVGSADLRGRVGCTGSFGS